MNSIGLKTTASYLGNRIKPSMPRDELGIAWTEGPVGRLSIQADCFNKLCCQISYVSGWKNSLTSTDKGKASVSSYDTFDGLRCYYVGPNVKIWPMLTYV